MKNYILIIILVFTFVFDFIILIYTIKSVNSLKEISGTIENVETSFSTLKKSRKTYTYHLKGHKEVYKTTDGLFSFVSNSLKYYPEIGDDVTFYTIKNSFLINENEIIALTKEPEKASNFKKWYNLYGVYMNTLGLLVFAIFSICFCSLNFNTLSNSQAKYAVLFFIIKLIIYMVF